MPRRPIQLFLHVAAADLKWRAQLEAHLAGVRRRGVVVREVEAGADERAEVRRLIEESDITLLLLSADAHDRESFDEEIELAVARSARACVIPVLLRAFNWRATPVARLKPLPASGLPVESWDHADEAWTEVVAAIHAALGKLLP